MSERLPVPRPGPASVEPYVPGKPLAELAREAGIEDAIKLASNENPLGPSPAALAAAQRSLERDAERYPDSHGHALKSALAALHGVRREQVLLGNGSNEVIELAVRAYAGPGDEVVYPEYGFVAFGIAARSCGATPVMVPAQGYGADPQRLLDAVGPRTRVLLLANPNHPTGTWLTGDTRHALISRLPPRVLVLLDQAYAEYIDQPAYPHAESWLPEWPNLLVSRTFSKIHGLAALRVGYGLGAPALIDVMNRIRMPFNVSAPALAAAEAALGDSAHIAQGLALQREGDGLLRAGLARLDCEVLPGLGNFVTLDLGRPAQPVYEALLQRGVIVRPLANYGLTRHLRVTVGLPHENRRFLDAFAEVLDSPR